MEDQTRSGETGEGRDAGRFDRRRFIKRAAATGIAVAWAAPVVQSIAATPAFAHQVGSPRVGCFHSNRDPSQSCMDACTGAGCRGNQCDGFGGPGPHGPCAVYCHIRPGNQCCNAGLCNPANFHCSSHGLATYSGPLTGCAA